MEKKTYTIGRAGDIKLKDETVSRLHACLEVDGDKLYLRDLDSHNGTYEIRDKELVPFTAGSVTQDQTFAFGECVRNVAQLLRTAELEAALATAARSSYSQANGRGTFAPPIVFATDRAVALPLRAIGA